MGVWAVVIGMIMLVAAIPTGWFAVIEHRDNTRRDNATTLNKRHYTGWDWFRLKYGHWMLWTIFTILVIAGGGLVYVFFTV